MSQEKREDLGSLPLVVISSSTAHERRLAADLALSQQSRRGRHIVALDSGHLVLLMRRKWSSMRSSGWFNASGIRARKKLPTLQLPTR